MQQGFNEVQNHQLISDTEQSAIAREKLVCWFARCKARAVFNNHIQFDESVQDKAIQEKIIH